MPGIETETERERHRIGKMDRGSGGFAGKFN